MTVYYNEIEPSAILWLQAAMNKGIIAYGHIDTRPIQEVEASDLKGYTQHHFFAGIGGWSIALRLTGWDDARPVWTGSCPCQSFSTAGQGKGKDDERHLWPVWKELIKEFEPTTIFGEQVAAAITHEWWDEVADDLEAQGYAAATAVLPAISVGRYHRRERLWFVADSNKDRCDTQPLDREQCKEHNLESRSSMANSTKQGLEERTSREIRESGEKQRSERLCALGDTDSKPARQNIGQVQRSSGGSNGCELQISENRNVVNSCGKRSQRKRGNCNPQRREGSDMGQAGLCSGTEVQWITCPDGKQRPVESSIRLLAHGIPAKLRKAALHGYGNAIVPELAAAFIEAFIGTSC